MAKQRKGDETKKIEIAKQLGHDWLTHKHYQIKMQSASTEKEAKALRLSASANWNGIVKLLDKLAGL